MTKYRHLQQRDLFLKHNYFFFFPLSYCHIHVIFRYNSVTYTLVKQEREWLSSSFKGYPLQIRHKQDWGREFILLLPGSDAGSDVVKPVTSFFIHT